MKSSFNNYSKRAHYYDLEFNGDSDRKIIKSLITENIESILEIPCGSGRHLNLMAKTNKKIVFADPSPEMITIVKSKIKMFHFNYSMSAKCANMLNYVADNPFNLILVPRESIQLLSNSDLTKALSNFRKNLTLNGLLYLDFAILNQNEIQYPNELPKYIHQQGKEYFLDINYQEKNLLFQRWHKSVLINDHLNVTFKYKIIDQGFHDAYHSSITLTNYAYDYLIDLFKKLKFVISAVYGNYNMTPYTNGKERMIFILKKIDE